MSPTFDCQLFNKQIIRTKQMTEFINMTVPTVKTANKPNNQKLQQTRSSIFSTSTLQMAESQQREKELVMIIREQNLPYDMVIEARCLRFTVEINVVLVEKDGKVVKVQDQQMKNFFIRKYIAQKELYQPSIDPLTGAVAFRFGFFQIPSQFNKQSWCIKKEKIINNLRLDKLFEQIRKFHKLLNEGQQFNFSEDIQGTKGYYLPLSKVISWIDSCDVRAFKAFIGKGNIDQPNQQINNNGDNNYAQSPKISQQKCCFLSQLSNQLSQKKRSFIARVNPTVLQRQLKKLQSSSQILSELTKRHNGKSNYSSLMVNSKTKKCINQQLMIMNEKNILNSNMKIVQGLLGKITISFDKQSQSQYSAKRKLLMMLPKNIQYHFLDNYFTNDIGVPISMSLSLEEQSILAYIEANAMVMSIETRMRVFVQLWSGVQTLWLQNNIILFIRSLRKIFITKNLTIKIRSLQDYLKVETHMLLQEKSLVNAKFIDNCLNFTEIYFKIFFGYDISFARSTMTEYSESNYRGIDLMRKNIGTKLTQEHQSLPSPMRDILYGMSYIFWEFVSKAEKINIKQLQSRNRRQVYLALKNYNYIRHQQYQQEILLNFKPLCCWLLKNLQIIVQQRI